jgi:NAD+ kinase
VQTLQPQEFIDRVNAVVSLGGDGTMLAAMRLLAGRPTPVLGVNHGNLGFLVEIPPAGLPDAIDRIDKGEFSLEPHSCLQLDVDGDQHDVAFNDVVVAAARPLTPITIDLRINDSERLGYYRCDALVACTPTGSTAYNYANGGPIISPSHPCMALTPVAPMAGISRTIVLGDEDVVTWQVAKEAPTLHFAVDGTLSMPLRPPTTLTLRLCPAAVNVMRLDPDAHRWRSGVKLSLLDLPVRPEELVDLFPTHDDEV